MKTAVFLAALAVPGLAAAQTARVKTGDHAGFTRLVVDLPEAGDWQLGRTPGGYELRLAGQTPPFDLTDAFRIITKDRLASIWTDPQTGNLQIGVACACHAVPFAFRPDIVVIDLRDGPPPPGSPFEFGLDGVAMPMLQANPVSRLRPRPAPGRPDVAPDDAVRGALPRPTRFEGPGAIAGLPAVPFAPGAVEPPQALPVPAVPLGPSQAALSPEVQAMRGTLLREFGRAASAGVIELSEEPFPDRAPPGPAVDPEEAARSNLAINGVPGLAASPANATDPAMTPEGGACLPDSRLDIAAWGDARPFHLQIAEAREKLLGEFDRPDPALLEKLVRLNLFFGFGAEARNVLTSFGADFPESQLWTAMAHVLDDQAAPPDTPFAGQIDCAGTVALWATLAEPVLTPGNAPDGASVALAFSALPLHLRRHLGAPLAEKMLSLGDISTAQEIRDAIWRAPGMAGPNAALLDARLDRERGNLADAAETLTNLRQDGGPTAPAALIDLVDTRLTMGQTVDGATIVELGALLHENRGSALEKPLIRAEMLALASAGDFDSAFARSPQAEADAVAELWAMLITVGQDAPLLTHAVLPTEAPVPRLDSTLRKQMADRLLALGFADQALRWLPDDAEDATLLTLARAELALGDARTALRTIAGLDGVEIDRLRAQALERLGDSVAAAQAFADAGDTTAEAAALWRAQDWQSSAKLGSEPVRAALQQLSPDAPPLPPAGNAPLAQGRALLDESAKAREAIVSLLGATQVPPPQP